MTYVPEDSDGVVRAHMWIGAGHRSCFGNVPVCMICVPGFPGSHISLFPHAYTVIFFDRGPSLPLNRALGLFDFLGRVHQWYGDILVVKHVGHDCKALQSMSLEEKGLVDAFLARLASFSYSIVSVFIFLDCQSLKYFVKPWLINLFCMICLNIIKGFWNVFSHSIRDDSS